MIGARAASFKWIAIDCLEIAHRLGGGAAPAPPLLGGGPNLWRALELAASELSIVLHCVEAHARAVVLGLLAPASSPRVFLVKSVRHSI